MLGYHMGPDTSELLDVIKQHLKYYMQGLEIAILKLEMEICSKCGFRTSLLIHWLRLHASTAGGADSIPS